MNNLAQRIEPRATWKDLILAAPQLETLRGIAIHVRQQPAINQDSSSPRAFGTLALFVGSSGTGNTIAAEVLANELKLDLYRIDLSQIVSKYIGETEKNLDRVFEAANASSVILFFDEADALFGHRTEIRDSHDRYANIEINYLLQRMEAYKGLSILAIHRKENIDAAFLRRIRFVVEFPHHPDAAI